MKKLLIILAFLLPSTSFAAVAFDNSGIDGGSGNNPHTFGTSMTATATTNFIQVDVEVNGSDTNSCTGGTVNGVTLKPTTARVFVSGAGTLWVYYAMNVGGTVTINMNGCTAAQTNVAYQSYTGVNSSAPVNASTTNTASAATSITTALTSTVDNSWETSWVMDSAFVGLAASTGVTSRGVYYSGLGTGDSGANITPAGSYSMKWTGNSGNWGTIQLALSPQNQPASSSGSVLVYIPQSTVMINKGIFYVK